MKIVYLVSSFTNKDYTRQAWSQKKTFAKNTKDDIFKWVYASDTRCIMETENFIFTPCSDDNKFIFLKTILAIEYVIDKYRPDYIVRSNNSSYINVPNLRAQIKTLNLSDFGFGFKSQHELDGVEEDFISGALFTMPLATAEKLVKSFDGTIKSHEDVQLSREVVKNNGVLISGERCSINEGEPFEINMHYRLKHSNSFLVMVRMFYIYLLLILHRENGVIFHFFKCLTVPLEIICLLLDQNSSLKIRINSLFRLLKFKK
jgi:hypothetical protein